MRYNRNHILTLMFSLLIFDAYADEPKVCFYMDDNYNGESLCTTQGNSVADIPDQWNDRISSISVPHGLIVTVYGDINFAGASRTFEADVDLVSDKSLMYLNDNISSFEIKKAVCFYGESNFTGDSVCLSGGEEIDLYRGGYSERKKSHLLNTLNDDVYSIKIPPGMQATVYEDDNYNGKYFVLTEDYTSDDLSFIRMNNKISSMRVSQSENFICDRFCSIKNSMHFKVQDFFGPYWSDPRIKYRDVLIDFQLSDTDNYSIKFFESGVIRVKDYKLFFFDGDKNNGDGLDFDLYGKSSNLSFLLRFNGGFFQIQFVESLNNRIVYSSPLIGTLIDVANSDIIFDINNMDENSPIVIDKMVLTVGKEHNRTERSALGLAACWAIPLLSIYNYIVQGHCNQVDKFVHNTADFFGSTADKILQVFGSSLPLAKVTNNETFDDDATLLNFMSDVKGQLTYITTNMGEHALTVPATALACKASMRDKILPHLRSRRDLAPGCIDWTLNILTDFTLLFGASIEYWNSENFGRVIENIVREGEIGSAVADVETASRLVESVQAHVAEATEVADIVHLKTAFDFSQLSYVNYLRHTEEEVIPPQGTQALPLGRYELSLVDYHFIETVPRIRQDGHWVERPDLHFDIEVIIGMPEETEESRQALLPIIEDWQRRYRQQELLFQSSEIPPESGLGRHEIEPLLEASRLTSEVASSWLRTSRDDFVYVVVRLEGQVISVTMAVDINDHDAGVAGSLTNPDYVLAPYAEGAVRGAGTAATRALADHFKRKGKISLVSSVISQPSAIVKKKVGFRFIEEL
ncbi:exotoxin [Yersinia similis]|uniref:Exotoxin n=1 Tax=Yersinia similis TaxID=367190 RepID=A0ABM5PTP0_9GAMM|nr:peptidase inhibitor family I36 protein [Yersinia similis]AHK18029.1 exotoxin [Yersinia similis]CFQ50270.1 beta-gamma-crystallin [Yersinia similis]